MFWQTHGVKNQYMGNVGAFEHLWTCELRLQFVPAWWTWSSSTTSRSQPTTRRCFRFMCQKILVDKQKYSDDSHIFQKRMMVFRILTLSIVFMPMFVHMWDIFLEYNFFLYNTCYPWNKHFIFIPIPKHKSTATLKYLHLFALGSNNILSEISSRVCPWFQRHLIRNIFICLWFQLYIYILSQISSFVCPWFQRHLIRNIFIYLPLVPTIYILSQISSFVCPWFQRYLIPLSAPPTKEVGYQGAVQPVPGEDPVFARVRMISPVEMDYAFVFAAWKDKDDHIKMDQWKR